MTIIYILLTIIAIGVLLISEIGRQILKWIAILGVVGLIISAVVGTFFLLPPQYKNLVGGILVAIFLIVVMVYGSKDIVKNLEKWEQEKYGKPK